ncbi:MAG: host specificity protein, partial [Paracoccaceae bacterium]
PGSVSVYSSASDSGYGLNTLLASASVIGATQTTLLGARPGTVDRGAALRVQLSAGTLSSVTLADVLNGANVAAIGDGSSQNWEIFQFSDATLVAPGVYDISGRLRGQAGSDALASLVWPAGSVFVLLDGNPKQIALAASERGLARHYRIGPAARAVDDPSYVYRLEAFDGIGLRPLAPVHLRARAMVSGDVDLSWVRRTRIDGDNWVSADVPLGEDSESYQL